MDVTQLVKKDVLKQTAYYIDERSCAVKLDANENPYSLSPSLRELVGDCIGRISMNRYPAPGSPELREKFAAKWGVDADMIVIGNGSDELIQLLLMTLDAPAAGGVVIPVPTFGMYAIATGNTGHRILEVPLDDRFDLDLDAIRALITGHRPELIFLSYPNNPSGNCFSRDRIESIIDEFPGIVVVDEAYFNFSGKTFLPDLKDHDNLVILRTLSKVGLAALRLGILMAHPRLVAEMNKVRLPYNLNSLSQAIGDLYVDHEAEFLAPVETIVKEREKLYAAMTKIAGITLCPTDANFILFSCHVDKDGVYETLIKKGILIKHFPGSGVLKDRMRVTIGTEYENKEFIRALRSALGEESDIT